VVGAGVFGAFLTFFVAFVVAFVLQASFSTWFSLRGAGAHI